MSNTDLLIRLRDLHEELAAINEDFQATQQVDEETIDTLGQMVTDASCLIDKVRASNLPVEQLEGHQELLDRIRDFESRHPSVTRFLSQMTDLLAMLGI